MDDKVLLRRDGAVATVIVNRPEKRNALDSAAWRLLGETVRRLSADETLRCVVFAGAGEKAFGSGNDISEFETARSTAAQVRAYNEITAGAVRAIENSLHPTVARIRGHCLGGGLEIALACDIRVAARDSKFGLPVRNMGIFLDPALANTLVNAVGRATALEMVLEGRIYDAEEALERGLLRGRAGGAGRPDPPLVRRHEEADVVADDDVVREVAGRSRIRLVAGRRRLREDGPRTDRRLLRSSDHRANPGGVPGGSVTGRGLRRACDRREARRVSAP